MAQLIYFHSFLSDTGSGNKAFFSSRSLLVRTPKLDGDSKIRSLLVRTPRLDGDKITTLKLYSEDGGAQIKSQDSKSNLRIQKNRISGFKKIKIAGFKIESQDSKSNLQIQNWISGFKISWFKTTHLELYPEDDGAQIESPDSRNLLIWTSRLTEQKSKSFICFQTFYLQPNWRENEAQIAYNPTEPKPIIAQIAYKSGPKLNQAQNTLKTLIEERNLIKRKRKENKGGKMREEAREKTLEKKRLRKNLLEKNQKKRT